MLRNLKPLCELHRICLPLITAIRSIFVECIYVISLHLDTVKRAERSRCQMFNCQWLLVKYWRAPLKVMCCTPWSRGINKLRTSLVAYRIPKPTSQSDLEARSNLNTPTTQQDRFQTSTPDFSGRPSSFLCLAIRPWLSFLLFLLFLITILLSTNCNKDEEQQV